ncbi:MAG: CvpA family protein [Candidatus Omnitrophota bacterium]
MPTEIIKSLNWIDILVGLIAVRIIYIGIKNGFVTELFKLLAVVSSIFISLHYYTKLADFLNEKIHLSLSVAEFIAFGSLWVIVMVVFKFLRDGFLMLLHIEAHSVLDRWGGLVLSVVRALLLCSLTLLFLTVTGVEYFKKNIDKSLTGERLLSLSPKIYEVSFNGLVKKFFPDEEINGAALDLRDSAVLENDKK